jgi:hypothetical protein
MLAGAVPNARKDKASDDEGRHEHGIDGVSERKNQPRQERQGTEDHARRALLGARLHEGPEFRL